MSDPFIFILGYMVGTAFSVPLWVETYRGYRDIRRLEADLRRKGIRYRVQTYHD